MRIPASERFNTAAVVPLPAVVATCLLLGGCDGGTYLAPTLAAAEVRADIEAHTFDAPGKMLHLSAVALDDSGNTVSGVTLEWSSTDNSVVTVSSGGLITARAAGTASIVVAALCCSAADTVAVTVQAAQLVAGTASATAGAEQVTLNATAPSYGTPPYTYQWHRSTSSGFIPGLGTAISGLISLDEVDTGLTNGTTYHYRLVITDEDGATAEYEEVSATPAVLEHPNEPAGFVAITNHTFDAIEKGGWGVYEAYGNSPDIDLTVIDDTTAPASPTKVGQMRFRQGEVESGSLTPASHGRGGWEASEVYVDLWLKFSPNWKLNDNAMLSKVFYMTAAGTGGGGDPLFFLVRATSTHGPMHFEAMHQNPDITPGSLRYAVFAPDWNNASNDLSPAEDAAQIVRGRWYRIEMHIVANTPGMADGEVHYWINGVKLGEFTGAEFISPGDLDGTFNNFRWEPVWGGQRGTVEEEMYQFIDNIYVSVKP